MNRTVYNIYHKDAPSNAIYIGRARRGEPKSEWGNPHWKEDKETNIFRFRASVYTNADKLRNIRSKLKNKALVCFCYPKACHGDVLSHIANCPDDEFQKLLKKAENGVD